MAVNEELLEMLVCPKDRTKVIYSENSLKCTKCGSIYPIKEDTPVFA